MTDWVEVNKFKMEKNFLEENIAEAKNYEWEKIEWSSEYGNHTHCIICYKPIPDKQISPDSVYYRSKGGWLCGYCFNKFLKS